MSFPSERMKDGKAEVMWPMNRGEEVRVDRIATSSEPLLELSREEIFRDFEAV